MLIPLSVAAEGLGKLASLIAAYDRWKKHRDELKAKFSPEAVTASLPVDADEEAKLAALIDKARTSISEWNAEIDEREARYTAMVAAATPTTRLDQ